LKIKVHPKDIEVECNNSTWSKSQSKYIHLLFSCVRF